MQKFNYKLKTFIKAVEIISERKNKRLEIFNKKGSGIRFELFSLKESQPTNFWVIHTEHNSSKNITSKKDYQKASYELAVTLDEFIEALEEIK